MKRSKNLAIFLLAGTMVTSGWAQANAKAADEAKPATADKPQSEPASVAGPDYVIGANDMLHISVWKEPDLTESLPVRPDGKISMPLLNDVKASGLTPTQLADSITTKLKKYIADPRVTVVVTAMNSQKIYILGEVLKPGADSPAAQHDSVAGVGFLRIFAIRQHERYLHPAHGERQAAEVAGALPRTAEGRRNQSEHSPQARRHHCRPVRIA